LSTAGLSLSIGEVLVIALALATLETCYRGASPDSRWRVKYLLLGIGAILVTRLYLLTHSLLFSRLEVSHLVAHAASLPAAQVPILVAVLRGGLADRHLRVSRLLLHRSVAVALTGLYLLGAGVFGWALSALEAPDAIFWVVLGLLVIGLAAAILLLSEDLRWRLHQIVGRYVYRHKYDYRDQWVTFTHRLGTLTTLPDLTDRLLETVSATVGATRGAVYLYDESGATAYYRAAALGPDPWPESLSCETRWLATTMAAPWRPRTFRTVGSHHGRGVADPVLDGVSPPALVVPLAWHGSPVGLILLGPERTGAPYDAEDVELLATLAPQAAGAIVNLRLAETAARARELGAFHRLTSVVLHDLKSTVSALTLLCRNAERHLQEPEFQRDALRTLARSVERMRALLGRLAPTATPSSVGERVPVDLRTLLTQLADTLPLSDDLQLVRALEPVPPVLGDPEALQRALRNLVDNALEAMEHRGTLTLATRWRPPWVESTISDTGCGMTPEFMRESLFVPFRSTKPEGWGVGLCQAREIVTAHGGQIELASEPGKGTTVTVLLPHAHPSGGSSKP
jgi:putative PEP-CTERM system histidine kinase